MKVTCQYCDRLARLTTGAEVYPNTAHLKTKKFWVCDPCKARVGCKEGTDMPLGNLADPHLRAARKKAHDAFTPLWKFMWSKKGGDQDAYRKKTYGWLASELHVPVEECRFILMEYELCLKAVQVCRDLQAELQKKYGTRDLLPEQVTDAEADDPVD